MERQELEKQIFEKLKEIQELYHQAYPQGDYLSLFITDESFSFNNTYWGEDEDFPLDFWKGRKGEEEC